MTVSVSAVGDRVEMAVTDEGPGITRRPHVKIFDAFYTTRAGGAGIGLAVVRRIIEDHKRLGATLEVRGADQPGATFVVGLARRTVQLSRDDRDRRVAVACERRVTLLKNFEKLKGCIYLADALRV